jgi:hypothetical protein
MILSILFILSKYSSVLLEEPGAEIRPVYLGVAVDTRFRGKEKIPLVPHAVALNADSPHVTIQEKKAIGRPVRLVASAAPLELYRRVFEDPGSSLLGMASKTYINVEFVPSPQTWPGSRAVRGVAVRTMHGALQNFVVCREMEPGLDFQVAGKAKVGLFFLQEVFLQRGFVHPMTVAAPHSPCLVRTSLELEEVFLRLMAFQAIV